MSGVCIYCGRSTHRRCVTCGGKELSDQFTEVEVVFSNHSRGRVGVCLDCKDKVATASPEKKAEMMESIRAGWDQDMDRRNVDHKERKAYHDYYKNVRIE